MMISYNLYAWGPEPVCWSSDSISAFEVTGIWSDTKDSKTGNDTKEFEFSKWQGFEDWNRHQRLETPTCLPTSTGIHPLRARLHMRHSLDSNPTNRATGSTPTCSEVRERTLRSELPPTHDGFAGMHSRRSPALANICTTIPYVTMVNVKATVTSQLSYKVAHVLKCVERKRERVDLKEHGGGEIQ